MAKPTAAAAAAAAESGGAGASTAVPSVPTASQWHSQYGQDKFIYDRYFATSATDGRAGVFVELGAADGLDKSNTLAFEERLGWTGVLIEPSIALYESLRRNRPRCSCVHACVARVPGLFPFSEDGLNSGFTGHRGAEVVTSSSWEYRPCRTLPEILDEHLGREAHIDYLSLDLEGAELDVLQSFDFGRHVVDVISIEVHHWLEEIRRERIAELLQRHGFTFVERLVADEIWVRRRGGAPDPGCLHPGLGSRAGRLSAHGGWSHLRVLAWRLLPLLQAGWSERGERLEAEGAAGIGAEALKAVYSPAFAGLRGALLLWGESEDTWQLESECPPGFLVLALVARMLMGRHSDQVLDAENMMWDLRRQGIFHPTPRYTKLVNEYGLDYQSFVGRSESEARPFEIRLPLGRAWHELAFLDALESGWPVFGYLDLASQLVAQGHWHEKHVFHDTQLNMPIQVPKLMCKLEIDAGGRRSLLRDMSRIRRGRGPRASTVNLIQDAEACALLGAAASMFHGIRHAVAEKMEEAVDRHVYVGIPNWTAGCQGPAPSTASELRQAHGRCAEASREACAALEDGHRPVALRCLGDLRPAPGRSLQLRRLRLLKGKIDAGLLEHGERLFREFVRRHGLYVAFNAVASPALHVRAFSPPQHASGAGGSGGAAVATATAAVESGVGGGLGGPPHRGATGGAAHASELAAANTMPTSESLFATLHGLQESLLDSEGLLRY